MGNLLELPVDLWQILLQAADLRGCANARYHVLALGIEQVFSVEFLLACARVTGESHACAAVIAHIAKDHALDVNGGAQVMGNLVEVAVVDGSLIVPRGEDSFNGLAQLLVDIRGERFTRLAFSDPLKISDQFLEIVCGNLGIALHACAFFVLIQDVLKVSGVGVQNDFAEHLNKTAVGIVSKAFIACQLYQPLDGLVIDTQVQYGIHHAGHREFCTRAHRDEQRIVLLAEAFARLLFNDLHGCQYLFPHARRKILP